MCPLHDLIVADESLFKQKSRIQWLLKGDQNTHKFHGMVAGRQHRNSTVSLTDVNENKLESFS